MFYKFKMWVLDVHLQFSLINGNKPSDFQEALKRIRRMTVKEAAILQTIPIEYKFIGSQSSIFRQIGNAVPCKLGYAVSKTAGDNHSSSLVT